MKITKADENRRSFLKKFLSGIAATAAIPWITSDAKGSTSFSEAINQYSGAKHAHDEKFWQFVKQQFPLDENLIYMNNGGLGPSPYQVIETINSKMLELESISETGHGLVESVHKKAAKFFNCGTDEIAFTRNSTESMNIIARGIPLKKGDEVLMTTHEHPGGAIPWLAVQKDKGIQVKLFEPGITKDENLKIIESNITRKTKVLMISHIPCTTGLIFPAKEIAELCHQKDIYVVYDGAQVMGMIPVDFSDMVCDFYTSSGHKWLCAPKGTGLLYIRREMLDVWQPTHVGAYSNKIYELEELKLEYLKEAKIVEYGTRNTPIELGIGAALDFFDAIGIDRVAARGRALAKYLKEQLLEMDKIELLTPMDPELSGSIVTFKIVDERKSYSDYIHQIKKDYNIRLRPIGEHGLNAIRTSLHIYNTYDQVDRLVEAIKNVTLKS